MAASTQEFCAVFLDRAKPRATQTDWRLAALDSPKMTQKI